MPGSKNKAVQIPAVITKSLHLFRRIGYVLKETLVMFGRHECSLRAAALSFHGVLSVFPLLLFLIFIGSQFLTSEATRLALDLFLREVLPTASSFLEGIIDQTMEARGPIGLIGGLGLLWTASTLFNALTKSMNVIWGAIPRHVIRRRLVATSSVLILAILFILSLTLSALAAVPWPQPVMQIWGLVNRGLGIVVTTLLFLLLYRRIPNCPVDVRAGWIAAFVAAYLWQQAKKLFALYLTSGLNNYGAVYGSLASAIALILWAYLTSTLLYLGAELAAALQREFWPNEIDVTSRIPV
jgi:membrane protein